MNTTPINNFRFCKKCERDLPKTIEYFSPRKTDKGGFNLYCKECINREKREKRKIKRENWDKGGSLEGKEGRKCTICKQIYPETSNFFGIHKVNSKGLDTYCKICRRKKGRDNYKKSNGKWNVTHANTRDTKRDKIIKIKKNSGGCIKCKEPKYWLLDFHHINSEDKLFQISQGESKGWKKLEVEINKCVLLCSNCHRDFHHHEREKGIKLNEYLK